MKKKKVFVSGCFDMLHSGHVRFLEEAAGYGDVYVGLGSDQTIRELKGRAPVNTQLERKYLLEALRHVKACHVNSGSGIMDFLAELKRAAPDIFIVNEDGNTPATAELCRQLGLEYVVLKRLPQTNLPVRSTTSLRKECRIPYRLDLAGGWLDQPFVSKHGAGAVLTLSLEPVIEFNERSGMASSSRRGHRRRLAARGFLRGQMAGADVTIQPAAGRRHHRARPVHARPHRGEAHRAGKNQSHPAVVAGRTGGVRRGGPGKIPRRARPRRKICGDDPSAVWLKAASSYDIFWRVLVIFSKSLASKSNTDAKTVK